MNTSLTTSNTIIRSNIFLPKEVDQFIKSEAKQQKTTKGNIIALAVKALKKQKLKKQMDTYYADPKNQAYEKELSEESLIAQNPL